MGEIGTFAVVFATKNSIRNLKVLFSFRVESNSGLIRFDSTRIRTARTPLATLMGPARASSPRS